MTIKFNYTQRIDFNESSISAKISENGTSSNDFTLDVNWDLSEYGLQEPFEVVVLAKALGETIRVGSGLGEHLKGFTSVDLGGMRTPLDCRIDLKVIRRDARGIPVILGVLHNAQPVLPDTSKPKKSLLRTKKDAQLDVPWTLSFEEGLPTLYVSDKSEIYEALSVSSPIFDAIVLPEVVRQVFIWVKMPGEEKDPTYVEGWKSAFESLGCPRDYLDEEFLYSEISESELKDMNQRALEVSKSFAISYGAIERLKQEFEGKL
jgi:hypothetical protein